MRPKPATESSQFAYWLVDQVELMPRLQRPVATWLLDIDGVINVDRPPRYGWGRYEHTVIPAFEGLAWPVCYSPMFVRILNTLHEKRIVSFRWLTTWEHDGPKKFAPLVGLDIGAWVAAEDDGDTRRWWKLRAFEQTEEEIEHLLIWTDDDMHDFRESLQVVDFLSEDVALAICPDSKQGLMPAEFNRILMGLKMWPR